MSDSIFQYSHIGEELAAGREYATGIVLGTENQSSTIGECAPDIRPGEKSERRKQDTRTLRRFYGVLLEIQDENARVILADEKEKHEYWLPAAPLRQAGVKLIGQPFEMDEFENLEQQEYEIGYRYRSVAKAEDARVEYLDFDEDRQQKLKSILSGWKHAQD